MSDAIKVGDTVRVKNPDGFLSVFARKAVDRDAIVEWVGPDAHGQFKGFAFVRFLKRNGRGKEFRERLALRDLMPVAKQDGTDEVSTETLEQPHSPVPRVGGHDAPEDATGSPT